MMAYKTVHPISTLALLARLQFGASCPPCPSSAPAPAPPAPAPAPSCSVLFDVSRTCDDWRCSAGAVTGGLECEGGCELEPPPIPCVRECERSALAVAAISTVRVSLLDSRMQCTTNNEPFSCPRKRLLRYSSPLGGPRKLNPRSGFVRSLLCLFSLPSLHPLLRMSTPCDAAWQHIDVNIAIPPLTAEASAEQWKEAFETRTQLVALLQARPALLPCLTAPQLEPWFEKTLQDVLHQALLQIGNSRYWNAQGRPSGLDKAQGIVRTFLGSKHAARPFCSVSTCFWTLGGERRRVHRDHRAAWAETLSSQVAHGSR